MTNGEKLVKVFPDIELYKKMHGGIQIDFDSTWWNAEYKDPTSENDLSSGLEKNSQKLEKDIGELDCVSRDIAIKALDYDIKCFEFKSGVSKHMDDIAKLLNTIYETQVNNIKALPSVTPQEPFINKPCISSGVCEHDKQNVLDKIRAEIEFEVDHRTNMLCAEDVFGILDKHKGESEE